MTILDHHTNATRWAAIADAAGHAIGYGSSCHRAAKEAMQNIPGAEERFELYLDLVDDRQRDAYEARLRTIETRQPTAKPCNNHFLGKTVSQLIRDHQR